MGRTMQDNTDVQEIHDGLLVDMRVESVLACIQKEEWNVQDFDTVFNEVVHEFVDSQVPPFKAAQAGHTNDQNAVIRFLYYMRLDFSVTFRGSAGWPGNFDYLPDATCAVSLHYRNDPETCTSYTPGKTLAQAVLGAVMQYAREKSLAKYNQGELRLN